jgi:hypothetical protein
MARNVLNFTWRRRPEDLQSRIRQWADDVEKALYQAMQEIAQDAEAEMEEDAPWTDRTGDARRGLFTEVVQAQHEYIKLYLSHGTDVDYGKWLELRWGGRFAIVGPMWQKYISIVEREIKRRFG